MANEKIMKFATRAIHGGQSPEPVTGAVMPPIFTSSTYAQESPGQHKGFEYSRSHNPTRFAWERSVASLEGGKQGLAFASGMAATSTILELLDSGDHIVAMDDLYGGSFRLFDKVRGRSAGLKFSYVDLADLSAVEASIQDNTRMIWVETPSNPMLKLVDIEAIVKLAKKKNPDIIVVVDNTFATPFNQRPLEMGADMVMHSATKYLNGHSDMVGGIAVVGDNDDLVERMLFLQNSAGAIAGPFDSYLALRGVKTLALRMRHHNEAAMELAKWLEQHPKVEKVIYPGLESHPQHELAKKQMQGFGGMISILLKGDLEAARKFLESVEVFALAESLGGVESLIEHPAIMTHASVPKENREKLGILDNFVRVSVGIEDLDDLKADLDKALNAF
ncbi:MULTISPECIES: cystathionine gamma-synthase [Idiomarina]|jgi:cystathionine gamma-lyase|uniref:cystathionine gamma-synthase n=1 Tax=Idiomarina TaxID=135575 RepID=UPI000C69A904|nr:MULTISPECIES: cystathionine gamma-synthase [Idiomarina]MAO67897.1 cystathionine gamma-synthase [Idiomarina sp.]MBF79639.1 cystathionine gamma-synthase [Idiomarina sp.]|tara:strand:- start:25390 stop:26562 length:1173 start_codon:yes stop_codon:yes gene_type:complete